ncbi:hypothetical protein SERLADRAFT_462347 [Serpula lacrymans var. lacrymans S7.9]|nr:uncharacterized protein SERLADRAFT_462347 [Serpula lacrymans var. lacrymans S7.9]EGO27983.1 hypothetical protein SERLADRAFT_462347 [Serpula lacrymans var. lacrymans S7.9]
MLISTRLDTLGDLLRSNKESMVTKGVASVRSPVCNLQQFSSTISHDAFVDAVVHEFRNEFDISEQACMIGETDELMGDDYIHKGMKELPSWEWAYGQTPEFEYKITRSFAWGDVAASIHSKHGIILSCSIDVLKGGNIVLNHEMGEIGKRLEGKRYGQIEDSEVIGARGQSGDILQWLRQEMEV